MKILIILSFVWCCLQPVFADKSKRELVCKPTVISLMIGGAYGQSYEITYDQRQLRYYSAKNFFELETAKPVVIKPTNKQWQTFFDDLDKLKVWKWNRDYTNPNVHDGVYWRAFITYETGNVCDLVSSGSNAYPADFKAFLAAVRKLIGEKKFERSLCITNPIQRCRIAHPD